MVEEGTHQHDTRTLQLVGRHLEVTDRSYEEILLSSQLSNEDIMALPTGGYVVEVGSGLMQRFAQGIKNIRPDLKVVSIDPTLALTPDRVDVVIGKGEDIPLEDRQSVIYDLDPFNNVNQDQVDEYGNIQRKRLEHAVEFGGIPSFGHSLPIRKGSVSLLVDSFAAGYYSKTEESFLKYMHEVVGVLAPRGMARIYPIGEWLPNSDITVSRVMRERAGTLVKEMMSPNQEVTVDTFIDGNGIGVKIRKSPESSREN